MAAIMTTPDRHAPDVSQLLRRPTTRPTLSVPNSMMEGPVPVATRHASAPTPLRRPYSGVPTPQPIPLSIGPTKRTAGELRRVRQVLPSRHPPQDPTESTCLLTTSSASKHEAYPSVPSIRRAQLSLQDLNAPKAKRRSVEFSQPPLLPKFVLSPADPKPVKSRSTVAPRLPAPVFTGLKPPELRRSSTHPTEMRADWSDGVSHNSDGMTRLSLCEGDKDDGVRLFGSPGSNGVGRAHHKRNRSSDAKKRLSLPKALEDVFDSSSSPHAAITPSPQRASRRPLSHPGVAIVPNGSPFHLGGEHITIEDLKPRSPSLPDFILPTERGIEKKRSNIAEGRTFTLPKIVSSKVSRLSDSLRPRDSGLRGFSFEGEHSPDPDADASFVSMTSLGSPVKEPTVSLPSDAGFFDFLGDLDSHHGPTDAPRPFFRAPSLTQDIPMVTPGVEPSTTSGWPGVPIMTTSSESDDEGDLDMDSFLFATMHAKQSGRASMPNPLGKPNMPDTPVKHAGRASMPAQRPWQTVAKSAVTHGRYSNAPRKSLPSKFTPCTSRTGLVADSPDSEGSKFSPEGIPRSPSPTLRTRGAVGTLRKPASGLGLGHPTGRPSLGIGHAADISPTHHTAPNSGGVFETPNSPSVGRDLLSGMGISKRRADLMRRTSSSAWSFSSESSSDGGLNTPSRKNVPAPEPWLSPVHRNRPSAAFGARKVSFIETSPLTSRSSNKFASAPRLEIPASPPSRLSHGDSIMSSAGSSPPITPHFPNFTNPFHRQPSPLPTPLYWSDSDEEDCNDNVILDFGINEEPCRFENEFICEEGLGAGSFGQAFRVASVHKMSPSGKPKLYAVKKSKPYEGPRHRRRLLEEYDILRHLSTTTTPRRSRSISLSWPSAPMEPPNVNVLQFIHGWEQDSMLCIQTELCGLGNMSEFLFEFGANYNRLDEPRIWKILSEVGNGILHIHHQNIIHLDLKPANIFITLEGRLKIGDFGMASRWPRPASFDGDGDEHGLDREGDREYLAPEILRGKYGREADIFSFGMIMLECAGNIVVPSMGEPWQRLRNHDMSDVDLSGLTPTLIDMIMRLMDPQPVRRPLIEQVCGHEVVLRTRSMMLRNIEAVRRASVTLINNASPEERDAAREAANVALFKASALGTEDGSFFSEVFSASSGDATGGEPMDTTP